MKWNCPECSKARTQRYSKPCPACCGYTNPAHCGYTKAEVAR